MFTKKPQQKTELDEVIDDLYTEMKSFTADSKEYTAMVDNLVKLNAVKENSSKKSVSPDVIVTVGANLAGIALILSYERASVVASKALSFVMKLR